MTSALRADWHDSSKSPRSAWIPASATHEEACAGSSRIASRRQASASLEPVFRQVRQTPGVLGPGVGRVRRRLRCGLAARTVATGPSWFGTRPGLPTGEGLDRALFAVDCLVDPALDAKDLTERGPRHGQVGGESNGPATEVFGLGVKARVSHLAQNASQVDERQGVVGLDPDGLAERFDCFARPAESQQRVAEVDVSVHEPGPQPDGLAIGMLGGAVSTEIERQQAQAVPGLYVRGIERPLPCGDAPRPGRTASWFSALRPGCRESEPTPDRSPRPREQGRCFLHAPLLKA